MSQIIVRGLGSGPAPANSFVEDVGVAVPAAGVLNILGGNGIATSGSGNTVTITATGSGNDWIVVTAATQNMAADTGYIANRPAGRIDFAFPVTIAFGSIIEITDIGGGGWNANLNVGQNIIVTDDPNVTLSAESISSYTSIRFLCTVANTTFSVLSSNGTLFYD